MNKLEWDEYIVECVHEDKNIYIYKRIPLYHRDGSFAHFEHKTLNIDCAVNDNKSIRKVV